MADMTQVAATVDLVERAAEFDKWWDGLDPHSLPADKEATKAVWVAGMDTGRAVIPATEFSKVTGLFPGIPAMLLSKVGWVVPVGVPEHAGLWPEAGSVFAAEVKTIGPKEAGFDKVTVDVTLKARLEWLVGKTAPKEAPAKEP